MPPQPDGPELCRVCRRRPVAPVCDACRETLARQLAAVPDLAGRLAYALVPAPSGGERVSASRESAPPVRLAALTLMAGGSDDARCVFVPKTRSWATVVDIGGVQVQVWQREPVHDEHGRPVMVLADDQVGVLPAKAWLAKWALEWRRHFGHSVAPQPVRRGEPATPAGTDAAVDRARVLLGLGAALLPAERPEDPAADEWALRFGTPSWAGSAAARDHRYLTTWLGGACDGYPSIGDFAASLRHLFGALRAALGDTDDLEYLGRCPEEVTDRRTNVASLCGTPIWHDPYVEKIVCPRCRTETDQRRRIWLARRILDAWPIDRRRRYPRGLIEILRMPACAACGEPAEVSWVDATERNDAERFWRPGALSCPRNGCECVEA